MREQDIQSMRDVRLSLGGTVVSGLLKTILWLVFAAMISVVIELILMTFVWPELGVRHSATMLQQERVYLAKAADAVPLFKSHEAVLRSSSAWTERGIYWTGLAFLGQWQLGAATEYVSAAINTLGVFIHRVFVLLLATPAFFIFGAVGLVRGLVARELRKWCGGRETSGTYHLALRALPDVTLGLWVIYLAMPVSINPFFIVGPVVVLFAFVLQQLAYRFKKYV